MADEIKNKNQEDKNKEVLCPGTSYVDPKDGGKKPTPSNFKTRNKKKKEKIKKKTEPKHNDWDFYAVNEQLAKDTASFPYNRIPGIPADINYQIASKNSTVNDPDQGTILTQSSKSPVMGILRMNFINSIGVMEIGTDGVNTAALQLYTFIRQRNSGAKNYEAPDLMMYILAMREIYTIYFSLKRALGLINCIPIQNRNMPKALVEALGIEYNDLVANAANYRAALNLLCVEIDAFAVPDYFKAFARSAFITSNVFMDSSSIRGQFMVYRQSGYYKWSPISDQRGSELLLTMFDKGTMKFSAYLEILRNLLHDLYLDEDINTMSGDILKAFGDGHLYKVLPTDETYVVTPYYDENAVAQIENSVSLAHLNSDALWENRLSTIGMKISQEKQLIIFTPTYQTDNLPADIGELAPSLNSFVLNSHKDMPDYKDNLEWTRLMTTADVSYRNLGGVWKWVIAPTCYGLEMLLSSDTLYLTSTGTLESIRNYSVYIEQPGAGLGTVASFVVPLAQVDWHPLVYIIPNGTALSTQVMILGDIKMSTIVSKDAVKATHDLAVTSAFWARDLYTMVNMSPSK